MTRHPLIDQAPDLPPVLPGWVWLVICLLGCAVWTGLLLAVGWGVMG